MDALAKAAREALRIAHFDPDTGDDLGGVTGEDGQLTQPCGKGCYNCLLSYRNQPYHEQLDRHRARDLLLAIAGGATLTTGRGESRTEQTIRLLAQADSTLEEEFVQWLKDHGHRLPDAAQVTVPEAYARPDFTYRLPGGPVAVFVDGPAHDGAAAAERDAERGRTARRPRLVRHQVPVRRRLAVDHRREQVGLRRRPVARGSARAEAGGLRAAPAGAWRKVPNGRWFHP